MRIIIVILSFLLVSCKASLDDARQVKVGMSTRELLYVMGEPFNIEVESGKETWIFIYTFGMRSNELNTTIVNDTVIEFITN